MDGRRVGRDFVFESRVYYVCDDGFEALGGSRILQCLETGLWDSSPPTCVPVNCEYNN